MAQFGTLTEPYHFYNGEIELQFDKKEHVYYLNEGGNLIPLLSVSSICKIIDKSAALIPWGCKMMAQKLFKTVPTTVTKSGVEAVIMPRADFEKLVMEAKGAHKERLEEAGEVGKAAHDWIEHYIKMKIKHEGTNIPWAFDVPRHDPRVTSCCLAALDWMSRHNVRWIGTEQKIYSRKHRFPGTLDGKATVDSCTDPKCCPVPYKNRVALIDWKTSNSLHDDYVMQVAAYDLADREEHGTEFTDWWVIRLGKEDGEFQPWHLDWNTVTVRGRHAFLMALELTRAVASIEDAQNTRKAVIKAIEKEEAAVRREEKLANACAGAPKYKGIRPPKCNGGNPCKSCVKKYVDNKWLGRVWLPLLGDGHDCVSTDTAPQA